MASTTAMHKKRAATQARSAMGAKSSPNHLLCDHGTPYHLEYTDSHFKAGQKALKTANVWSIQKHKAEVAVHEVEAGLEEVYDSQKREKQLVERQQHIREQALAGALARQASVDDKLARRTPAEASVAQAQANAEKAVREAAKNSSSSKSFETEDGRSKSFNPVASRVKANRWRDKRQANNLLRDFLKSEGCDLKGDRLQAALAVCGAEQITTVDDLRELYSMGLMNEAGFEARTASQIALGFKAAARKRNQKSRAHSLGGDGIVDDPSSDVMIRMDNPLTHVLDNPGSPMPSTIDRLRSALSPRSRGAGTYSPVPRPTKAGRAEQDMSNRFDDIQLEVVHTSETVKSARVPKRSKSAKKQSNAKKKAVKRKQKEIMKKSKIAVDLDAQNLSRVEQAARVRYGCQTLFREMAGDDDEVTEVELGLGLEENHMMVSMQALTYLFHIIDADHSKVITEDEFAEFLVKARPCTAKERTLNVVSALRRTLDFWMMLSFIVGTVIGVCVLMLPKLSEATLLTLNQLYCWSQLVASIGFVFLAFKFNLGFANEIDHGRLELLNSISKLLKRKSQSDNFVLPADRAGRMTMAATLLMSQYDTDGNADFGIAEWRELLHGSNILISDAAMNEMFKRASVNGDNSVCREEFIHYIKNLRPFASIEKVHYVLKLTCLTYPFWLLLMFVLGSIGGLGNVVFWRTTLDEHHKHSIDILNLYLNAIGSLGFIDMVRKTSATTFDGIERARNELCELSFRKYEQKHEGSSPDLDFRNDIAREKALTGGAQTLFDEMDGDDGMIDINELRAGLEADDFLISRGPLQYIFDDVDVGKDKCIEPKEFVSYIGSLKPATKATKDAFVVKQTLKSFSFWLLFSYTVFCVFLITSLHDSTSQTLKAKLHTVSTWGFLVASVGGLYLSYHAELEFFDFIETTTLKLKMHAMSCGESAGTKERSRQSNLPARRQYHAATAVDTSGDAPARKPMYHAATDVDVFGELRDISADDEDDIGTYHDMEEGPLSPISSMVRQERGRHSTRDLDGVI